MLKFRVYWLVLSVLVFMWGGAQAQNQNPQIMAQEVTQQLLDALQMRKAQLTSDPSKVYELVDQILLPHFDFRKMAQLVLGRETWQTTNDAQKERFITEFRNLLVRTYATSLMDYSEQKVIFKPLDVDLSQTRRVTVSAEVESPGASEPLKIDSEMYLPDPQTGWKVYDLKVAGISLVTNYRSSYDTAIKKSGLEALIDNLEAENRKANLPQSSLSSKERP